MRIVFATGNKDKLREIGQILKDCRVEIISMKDAGIDGEAEETGRTFEENAVLKARYVYEKNGKDTSYHEKNNDLIRRLEGVPDEKRSARFVCAMALIFPDGRETVVRQTMEGRIGYAEAGENGFGYDPIFFLPEYGMTSAEVTPEEKNSISHRGKALREVRDIIIKEYPGVLL